MHELVEKKLCPNCGKQMSYYEVPGSHAKEWYCEHCDTE
ncbi:MAG: transposase [Candidatus Methanofastidiosa archaeon]|nr:transposase [Candidatus Methanofastidiosa archaeon]